MKFSSTKQLLKNVVLVIASFLIPTVSVLAAECGDGFDNDLDGAVDFPLDFSCASANDSNEAVPLSQCQNGLDDDKDGLTDLFDSGCANLQDAVEAASPQSIEPTLECVRPNSDGTYTAYFGYKNPNNYPVSIPFGSTGKEGENSFSPPIKFNGQTTYFYPLRSEVVSFPIIFDGFPITWKLRANDTDTVMSVTASAASKRCIPIEPILNCVQKIGPTKYVAHFGYNNQNRFVMGGFIYNDNRVFPEVQYKSQPYVFLNGNYMNAFTEVFESGNSVTWKLGVLEATANSSSISCDRDLNYTCKVADVPAISCQGQSIAVQLKGDQSFAPDRVTPMYKWMTDCQNATFSSTSVANPILYLNTPSSSANQSCTATLKFGNGEIWTECSTKLNLLECLPPTNNPCSNNQTIDKCGICGGNNACLDCAGIPYGNKQVDSCGVCDGNNSSCLGCIKGDNSTLLLIMDSESRNLLKLIESIAKRYVKLSKKSTSAVKLSSQKRKEALDLHLKAWQLTWAIPAVSLVCTNSILCSSTDNQNTLQNYNQTVRQLREIVYDLAKQMQRLGKVGNKVAKASRKSADQHYNNSISTSSQVPRFNSKCD